MGVGGFLSNIHSRVGHFGQNLQFSPLTWSKLVQKLRFVLNFLIKIGTICLILSYFVSIGHILTHLVKFCLFQPYFTHIMSYLWYFFSWSISHQIDKVGQIIDVPPQPVTPRIIPEKRVCLIDSASCLCGMCPFVR